MTSYSATYPTHSNPNYSGFLKFILIVFLALGVIYTAHAVEHHGADAIAVRKCLDDQGPYMVLKSRFDPTFYLLCKLESGLFGIQAVNEKGGWERTSFIKGTWKDIQKYFQMGTDNPNATLFTKKVPWLK